MPRLLRVLAVLAALTLFVAACSSDDPDDDSASEGDTEDTTSDDDAGADAEDDPGTEDDEASADEGETAQLVIWTDESRTPIIQEIGQAFTTDTGVEIVVQQLDFGEIRDDLITQGPAGEGPDILIGAHDWLGQLVSNGVVAPIELGEAASLYEEVALSAFSYEGQLYGVPYAIENVALFRNTALAAEPPADWDDMIATGQALVDAGEADFPLALQVGAAGDPYHFYPLFSSYGDAVFGVTGDGSYDPDQLNVASEGGLAFAELLGELGSDGILSPDVTFDLALETFAGGRAPFIISGPWNVGAIQEAGVDFVVEEIPGPGGSFASPFVGVQGFMVSAYAANPLIANDFVVNYLGSEEVARSLYETGQRPPAMISIAEEAADDPIVAGFSAVGANGHPLPSIPAMNVVWEDWGTAQRDILLGDVEPVERMQQAADQIVTRIASE